MHLFAAHHEVDQTRRRVWYTTWYTKMGWHSIRQALHCAASIIGENSQVHVRALHFCARLHCCLDALVCWEPIQNIAVVIYIFTALPSSVQALRFAIFAARDNTLAKQVTDAARFQHSQHMPWTKKTRAWWEQSISPLYLQHSTDMDAWKAQKTFWCTTLGSALHKTNDSYLCPMSYCPRYINE